MSSPMDEVTELEAKIRLNADVRKLAKGASQAQIRALYDLFSQVQKIRIGAGNRISAAGRAGESADLVGWFHAHLASLEKALETALLVAVRETPVGRWALSVTGLGPRLVGGLVAMIDPAAAPHISSLWRYAGLDPTAVWAKGEKPPWNLRLKRLCYLIGDSFVKNHNRPECFYGKIYEQTKAQEAEKNERGGFAVQAAAGAERVGKKTESYKAYATGKLPLGHLDMRARRKAVKIFLSHYWIKAREAAGLPVTECYAIAKLGHTHRLSAE